VESGLRTIARAIDGAAGSTSSIDGEAQSAEVFAAEEIAPVGFDLLTREHMGALQRIARGTPHRLRPDELLSEAWILACEQGKKRGMRLDLRDPSERDVLMGCLYNRHVKFVRGKHREESLDCYLSETHGRDAPGPWYQRLSAPDATEPLAQLLRLDEQQLDEPAAADFSEFSAYRALLLRFDSSCQQLAAHLDISLAALRRRIERARDRARVQTTLVGFRSLDGNFVTKFAWFQRLRLAWHARRAAWGFRTD
jgi:hypothetical protein